MIALIFGILIVAQSPKVQTFLAQKAIKSVEKSIDGKITIEKLSLRPFDAIVLKNIAIIDNSPYSDTAKGYEAIDTLFRADYVTATFSIKGLFGANKLKIKSAAVRNGELNLVMPPEKDSSTRMNLVRVLNLGTSQKESSNGISRVEIDNFRFRLKNYNSYEKKDIRKGIIDWSDLDVKVTRLRGHGIKINGKVIQGVADELSLMEKSGYIAKNITGSAKVGEGRVSIRNVRIKDSWSDIHAPSITMTYKDKTAWSDFVNKVRMEIKLDKSHVDMESIGFFAPALKQTVMTADMSAVYEGYVNDFSVRNLNIKTHDSNLSGIINGRITGLPASRGMMTDVKLKNFSFTLAGLEKCIKGWAPKAKIPIGGYAPDEVFVFNGGFSGPLNRLSVRGKAKSGAGGLSTTLDIRNLIDKNRAIAIGGDISTDNLDIGKILNIKKLGECSLKTTMSASLGKSGQSVNIDSIKIFKLKALGYEYHDIAAIGKYEDEAFDGKIVCSDPNLNFIFQGTFTPSAKRKNAVYQFYANVGYANLHALNIDKKEPSGLSLKTMANFKVVNEKDVIGNIDIKDLVLDDMHGLHNVGDISISSHVNDDAYRIKLGSAFANASYVGSGFFDDFIKDLKAVTAGREIPALFKDTLAARQGNEYMVSMEFHDTKDVLAFFVPGLYIADSTTVNMNINTAGLLQGNLKSRRIAFMDKYIKNVSAEIDNAGKELSGEIISDEIRLSPIVIENNRLLIYAKDNNIGLGFSYDNESELTNSGEIYMRGRLMRENGFPALKAEVLPSNIYLNSNGWAIGHSDISLDNKGIKIDKLSINNNLQSILIDGGYSKTLTDTLNITLDKFDIGLLNNFMKKDYGLKGRIGGYVVLSSPPGNGPGIQMNMKCDSTYFAGERAGNLDLSCIADKTGKVFNISCKNDIDGENTIDGSAVYISKKKTLEGHLSLNSFNIGYAEPFLKDIFNVMQGRLTAEIAFDGPVNKLNINSESVDISDGKLGVDFTNVVYDVNGKADINSKGVYFNNISITDRYGAGGQVNGSIKWDHFKDMSFDTRIVINEAEVMDIPESAGAGFYGNVFATGTVGIKGPSDAILIEADASTSKSGNFNVTMSQGASANSSDLLVFKGLELPDETDPYEEMMTHLAKKKSSTGKLGIRLHINVDPGTEAIIEIDKESGNVLSGRGNGTINVEVQPAGDIFNLNGDYNITGGKYHFDALGIVKKDLIIQNGSTIKFNGDIMDSELDIKAIYKTKASIGTLIADTTSTTRRNVECVLSLKDRLSSPRVGFAIDIPDLDPTTQAAVENALSTDDKVQKQFLSLLVSNSFLPDERSGIVNNSRMLNTTVADIMSNQLNNILETLNIPVDLGLDYQNSHGSDIFDVALSTALFNNRVIVNGTIGNRKFNTTTTNQEIVGDLDIEIKLDKPGSLRLKLFSHSADQYTSYLDNSQRNGVGLTYQKEFNNFKEFFANLFKSKKRRMAEKEAMLKAGRSEEKVKISIKEKKNGK